MPLVARTEFIGGDADQAYLYTAGHGLSPKTSLDAAQRYFETRSESHKTGGQIHDTYLECKRRIARLMQADPEDIALLGSSSEGNNAIYSLIDWQPGDNIVLTTNELEFPSVVQPAVKRQNESGIEIRVVDHDNWEITPEMIGQAVDQRTRLVFLSHISYRTGHRFDLNEVGKVIRSRSNALFAVDAAQSLGLVPVDASACDFMVGTGCKWLLGPHGVAPFFWNHDRQPEIEPVNVGWYSVVDDLDFPYQLKPDASRFELGGPPYLAIHTLNEGLRIIETIGVDTIETHASALGTLLIDQLREFDLEIITPADPSLRAGIVSWLDRSPEKTAAKLAKQGVIVTGSSGRVRASMHLYNDETDVDRLITALKE